MASAAAESNAHFPAASASRFVEEHSPDDIETAVIKRVTGEDPLNKENEFEFGRFGVGVAQLGIHGEEFLIFHMIGDMNFNEYTGWSGFILMKNGTLFSSKVIKLPGYMTDYGKLLIMSTYHHGMRDLRANQCSNSGACISKILEFDGKNYQ